MDSRWRSLVKSISYRFYSALITFFISWLVTRNIKVATVISVIEIIVKILTYFLHERIWTRVPWGAK